MFRDDIFDFSISIPTGYKTYLKQNKPFLKKWDFVGKLQNGAKAFDRVKICTVNSFQYMN